jgi:predicted nucleotidyltransferase
MANEPAPRFGLSAETLGQLRRVFARHAKVKQVLLYGSRAKGNYRPGSDIDLTLCGENLTLSDLLKMEQEIDDLLLPYKTDLSLLDRIDSPDLLDHIRRVGKILYGPEEG